MPLTTATLPWHGAGAFCLAAKISLHLLGLLFGFSLDLPAAVVIICVGPRAGFGAVYGEALLCEAMTNVYKGIDCDIGAFGSARGRLR